VATSAVDEFAGFTTAPTSAASADEFADFTTAPAGGNETPSAYNTKLGGNVRVAGLGARALAEGAGDIADTSAKLVHAVADIPSWASWKIAQHLHNAFGLDPLPDSPLIHSPASEFTSGNPTGASVADTAANAVGLPAPQTSGERIGSAAIRAVPSVALAPEAPIAGAISAGLSGAASQTVAENGGGPVAQTIAGLVAGVTPSGAAGLTRLATRGGSAGQVAMQARLADAAANGADLTVGQATGSKLLQKVEAASGKLWGGGSIKAAAEDQSAALSNRVDQIVGNLSPGADISPTGAGEAINTGVAATRKSMKSAEKTAYDAVDQHVPETTGIDISGTLSKLDQIATPTPGATATSGSLIPQKIADLRNNLAADVKSNGGSALPYSAVRSLKTALGNSIDWGFSPADPVTNGALKSVYGSLKGDITTGVSAVSPTAKQAVAAADAMHGANQDKLELLNGIVDKVGGPEAVFQAATSGTKQGATKIGGVMAALDPEQQNIVRASILDRMSRAVPSQQDATGSAFNPETFLTKWADMSPEAKSAVFGKSGMPGQLRSSLDSLASTLDTLRKSGALKNPSGTAEAGGHSLGLGVLLSEGGAALLGHPHALAATGGGIVGNMVLSRVLTNPKTAAWLAASTKLPQAAIPAAVATLSRMGNTDPDARGLADYLKQHGIGTK
jgi:hypothetical protein